MTYTNVCTRCGKERVVIKTWKKKEGNSMLTHVLKSCPDLECQKKVDANLLAQDKKRMAFKQKFDQKAQPQKEAKLSPKL